MLARIQSCKVALMSRTWGRGLRPPKPSCGAKKNIARRYGRAKKQGCLGPATKRARGKGGRDGGSWVVVGEGLAEASPETGSYGKLI